jgi:NAD+ synthase
MGRELGVIQDIIDAAPTDGLWADGRTDEDQLGMSYAELETMMRLDESGSEAAPQDRSKLKRYREIRARNLHKMQAIPVCAMPKE